MQDMIKYLRYYNNGMLFILGSALRSAVGGKVSDRVWYFLTNYFTYLTDDPNSLKMLLDDIDTLAMYEQKNCLSTVKMLAAHAILESRLLNSNKAKEILIDSIKLWKEDFLSNGGDVIATTLLKETSNALNDLLESADILYTEYMSRICRKINPDSCLN